MRIFVALLPALVAIPTSASATPYDKMFEVGTTMVYDETHRATYGGGTPIIKSGKVTCRVASVTTIARANVSTIECDTEYSPVAGQYLSTKRGLWHFSGDTARDVRRTLREPPMMPARPWKRVRDNSSEEGIGERVVIEKKNGRWCEEYSSSDPNGSATTTTCFANGVIVEITRDGMWYGEGGGTTHAKSVLVP